MSEWMEQYPNNNNDDHDLKKMNPYLIFVNHGSFEFSSYIKNFSSFKNEQYHTIQKKRIFDYEIYDGAFQLFAFIIYISFHKHYVAYLRPHFNVNAWYYYDDLRPTFVKCAETNHELSLIANPFKMKKCTNNNNSYLQPKMLFYIKLQQ